MINCAGLAARVFQKESVMDWNFIFEAFMIGCAVVAIFVPFFIAAGTIAGIVYFFNRGKK